jgi:hypothetical protein
MPLSGTCMISLRLLFCHSLAEVLTIHILPASHAPTPLVLCTYQVTSSAKKKRDPGSTRISQTPDGSFYDLQRNAWHLLQQCGVKQVCDGIWMMLTGSYLWQQSCCELHSALLFSKSLHGRHGGAAPQVMWFLDVL